MFAAQELSTFDETLAIWVAEPHATKVSVNDLGLEHQEALREILTKVIATEIAKETYAQIIEGLPLLRVFEDCFNVTKREDLTAHGHLSSDSIAILKKFKGNFNFDILQFDAKTARAYQNTTFDLREFKLRLLEMIAVACHKIAALLYKEVKGDAIPTERILYQPPPITYPPSYDGTLRKPVARSPYLVLPTDFYHMSYQAMEQYPDGIADVVGYWAELRILGAWWCLIGGRVEKRFCKDAFLHPQPHQRMMHQLHDHQIDQLVNFESVKKESALDGVEIILPPLPFQNERYSRRLDEWDALDQNIFRDMHERRWDAPPPQRCVRSGEDVPELQDAIQKLRSEGQL
ncbi:uncharacterized protein BDZ99DRAFT_526751 [Mytilinidion resinicola]|uniref:Uncharacterized protein n=1 Tax=Mytilinidion resinicola TaxID=574789 RepID=A0A6A6Y4F2_9PEZI|nr:uncharacterized protein BDZ99DRAFT_526751 [Mytilinidion resinicola]KAF2803398.1 hypothetical protein BDZ99DRAFT_526751 [Mytilinidion resinicola]